MLTEVELAMVKECTVEQSKVEPWQSNIESNTVKQKHD